MNKHTFAPIPNWLLRRTGISFGAKVCYARLKQYAGNNNYCYPSQKTLAKELGTSPRNVRRFLSELKKHDLIYIEYHHNKPNTYQIFTDHEWMEGEYHKPTNGKTKYLPHSYDAEVPPDERNRF